MKFLFSWIFFQWGLLSLPLLAKPNIVESQVNDENIIYSKPNSFELNPEDKTEPIETQSNVKTEVENNQPPLQESESDEDAQIPPQENLADVRVDSVVEVNEFSGTPFFENGRRRLAIGEAPEFYTVQPGDNLHDICDQLIGDQNYWPKLWALNPGIKNPHFIYPGMELKFYPGDEINPPFLEVLLEDDLVPIETGELSSNELIDIDVRLLMYDEIKPETVIFEDVSDRNIVGNDIESLGFDITSIKSRITVPAFFTRDEMIPLGQITSGADGSVSAIENKRVILSLKGEIDLQSLYTLVRPTISEELERIELFRYEFVAHIKLDREVAGNNQVFATITTSRLGAAPGDLIIPYRSTNRFYELSFTSSRLANENSFIIGFSEDSQTIGGRGDLVFLKDSLRVGATYEVFQNINRLILPSLDGDLDNTRQRVASLQIIEANDVASLGLITESQEACRLGDRLGLEGPSS